MSQHFVFCAAPNFAFESRIPQDQKGQILDGKLSPDGKRIAVGVRLPRDTGRESPIRSKMFSTVKDPSRVNLPDRQRTIVTSYFDRDARRIKFDLSDIYGARSARRWKKLRF